MEVVIDFTEEEPTVPYPRTETLEEAVQWWEYVWDAHRTKEYPKGTHDPE